MPMRTQGGERMLAVIQIPAVDIERLDFRKRIRSGGGARRKSSAISIARRQTTTSWDSA